MAHCRFRRIPLFKPQFRVIAPVAQLDRALPSEGKGQRFESSRARQLLLGKVVLVQAVSSEALLHRAASKQPVAKEAVPKPKALFRMPFPLLAFPFLGLARSLAMIAFGLGLLSAPAVGASETVPIKRLSPEAARPSIVKDAIEAADWMAKSLVDRGYKADFSLESLKEVDRFIDDEAPDGKPKPGGHLAQQFGAQIFGLGAYLGETIRRQGDGQWEGNDRDAWPEVTLAVRLKSGALVRPTQRVLKRLETGPENNLYPFGVVVLSE